MMNGDSRTYALVELMKRREKDQSSEDHGHEAMAGGGDFMEEAHAHCKKGLSLTRSFLEDDGNADSALRPKVEALAAAYEDLLSALGEDTGNPGSMEEEY
jgi:hypothetical protein